jgi:hypothetical protein
MNPPAINMPVDIGTSITGISPETKNTAQGPLTIPASITARQAQSEKSTGWISPANMPVAPMIRPTDAIKSTDANPINTPPPKEAQGVNAVSIISSPSQSWPTFPQPVLSMSTQGQCPCR